MLELESVYRVGQKEVMETVLEKTSINLHGNCCAEGHYESFIQCRLDSSDIDGKADTSAGGKDPSTDGSKATGTGSEEMLLLANTHQNLNRDSITLGAQ